MTRKHPPRPTAKRILVTSALPYANGDIHLGHLVEAVQTDIYVQFQRMRGNKVVYVCADDTHGTPVELSALKQGIAPERLIADVWRRHVDDYALFDIGFDIFYSTNSEENRYYAEHIYSSLNKAGLITRKEITQFYCESCGRFLPDRFVTGTCPKCGTADQYGDVCESCGSTYEPTELADSRCMICKAPPRLKPSTHLYVSLGSREQFLGEYLFGAGDVLQRDMENFVKSWIDGGLRDWCISRDGPYFGFAIPGEKNKFFYVWLDAPIGYVSSTAKWCGDHGEKVESYWGRESDGDIVHFIGKDIVYFHTLFWPVMLESANFKLPAKIFVHGFLTVQGEKMSKSRGTFILARDYVKRFTHPMAAPYLRFFYGSKLDSHAGDIDLNAAEFCNRVNTTLVNNIGNLHHRTSVFCERSFGGRVPDAPWDPEIAEKAAREAEAIAAHYEKVEYKQVVERIHVLGNLGNKYYQDNKPWELAKTDREKAATVMTTCMNLVKALAVFLKPLVPPLAEAVERQLGRTLNWNDFAFDLRDAPMGATEKIAAPVEEKEFLKIFKSADSLEGKSADTAGAPGDGAQVDIDAFRKLDLRIAEVTAAERIPRSDKLLKLTVTVGDTERRIVAGIARHYEPQKLVGRRVVIVANLKPVKLMGEVSRGMLLAARDGDTLALVQPDEPVAPGAQVS